MDWISVEDRLPEEDGCYIATDGVETDVPWYYKNCWMSECLISPCFGEVTHWMPLPCPQKEGE